MSRAQEISGSFGKAFGLCGRCFQEKEVVQFFFDWKFASGRYALCQECLDIIGGVFEVKPDPRVKAPEYMVVTEGFDPSGVEKVLSGKREKAFFENIRNAVGILKKMWPFNAIHLSRKIFKK